MQNKQKLAYNRVNHASLGFKSKPVKILKTGDCIMKIFYQNVYLSLNICLILIYFLSFIYSFEITSPYLNVSWAYSFLLK